MDSQLDGIVGGSGNWEVGLRRSTGQTRAGDIISTCLWSWLAFLVHEDMNSCPWPHTPTIVRFFSTVQGHFLQLYLVD